jgi:lipopolysaccharide assembly outer membrane protein LptD (OstA)
MYDAERKLLRFTNANFAINGSFRSMTKKEPQRNFQVGPENMSEYELLLRYPDFFVDFNIPWNFSFSYALNMTRRVQKYNDTLILAQTLNLRGDLSITKNWKVNVTTNIDITARKLSTTTIEVYRDLHCWQMRFVWIPVGSFRSYNFNLNVKSALLQDLKISRRKGWNDFTY